MTIEDEDFIALENSKITWNRFYTLEVVRRASLAPTKFSDWSKLQLPNNSVLHTLNGFDTLESPTDGLPDVSYPLLQNEKNVIYLKLATQISADTSKPLGVDENYIFRAAKMTASITHFFQKHRKFHRILSDRTLSSMAGVLTWVDYSPLNEAKVNGTLHEYRKFDILFRTILNSVSQIGNNKHHFILIPQSNEVYPRALLQRTFRDLSTSTLGAFKNDPSIYPILHVLGYIYGMTHELSVTPYKADVKLLGKDSPVLQELKSTSLLERLDKNLFESINFVFYRNNRAVVYNLKDIFDFSEDTSFYTRFYRHIMNLRLSDSSIPSHIDLDSDTFDTFVDSVSTSVDTPLSIDNTNLTENKALSSKETTPTPVNKSSTIIVPTILPDTLDIDRSINDDSTEIKIRKASTTHVESKFENSPKIKSKHDLLIDNHFKVNLNGKSIGELIEKSSDETLLPKTMDFLTRAPEESYKKSSIVNMDKLYQQHMYHHELAKVIGSVAKHGMFITKIEESRRHSEMDRSVTYKVGLTDLDGRSHHIKFTVPDVDTNGLMKLGGVEYRLTRQVANVPICKISPTRVNLSSYYNKVIIERIQSKRFSFENDIKKLVLDLKSRGLLNSTVGTSNNSSSKLPYDYSAIGRSFVEIKIDNLLFRFTSESEAIGNLSFDDQDRLTKLKALYGVYVGEDSKDEALLFWDMKNQIHLIDKNNEVIKSWRSFTNLLVDQIGSEATLDKTSVEWTQAHILNQTIPLVFILGYEFGLKTVLDKIKLDYRFYTSPDKPVVEIDDIVIKFKDGTLVFNRYPLSRSLIASGLAWVSLKDVLFNELNYPEPYVRVFNLKSMSVGVLKGLRGFIDFFVDPITESILEKMHEPTTFSDLLLRANVMLTDYYSDESSSMKSHRFRLYERFNGIVYNEVYRALANYRNNPSSKKNFSINPEAVFQATVQDATVSPNDTINPIHELKEKANVTFTGGGGRSSNSFVLKDRIYPRDALGIISDAVPDSGKVGITAYLSASPNIDDIHGIPNTYKPGDILEAPQLLSIGAMIMPMSTTDDGKRTSYTSIQLSHYVPNHVAGETLSVRTGYDSVLPHLTSDLFAVPAVNNGIVESIDDNQKVIRVKYDDISIPTTRSVRLPYLDQVIDKYKIDNHDLGFLISDKDIANFPVGEIVSITKNTNGRIIDRLKCDDVESIPDKDIAKKQNTLVYDLTKGKYKSLYYIRFRLINKTTPGEIKSYPYHNVYSPISGSFVLQKKTPNVVVGEKFKQGDILIYNSGFFVPSPLDKQVSFKHGVTATVALMEKGSNHEDACEISKDLSDRLEMNPCHQREIITKRDAAILSMVKLGNHVETSDSLCIISDDYLISSGGSTSIDNLDLMEKLNRQTPLADYTGFIRKIRILYACDKDKLSDSLKSILKTYEKEVRQTFSALNGNGDMKTPDRPGYVSPGTRYLGVVFDESTVVLEFMIEETLKVSEGDKIVIMGSAKSIVSHVSEKQHYSESKLPIDMLFSTTSIFARIIASPYIVGIAERNMEELKNKVVDMYFE